MTSVAPAAAAAAPVHRGRTTIARRSLETVALAAAASAFDADRRDVSVSLGDSDGALEIGVRAALRAAPLGRDRVRIAGRASGTLLERIDSARAEIRREFERMTGRTVGAVTVRVTDVRLRQEGRVR